MPAWQTHIDPEIHIDFKYSSLSMIVIPYSTLLWDRWRYASIMHVLKKVLCSGRGYSRHWGHSYVVGVSFWRKKKNTFYLFALPKQISILIISYKNIIFQNSWHQTVCDSQTQQRFGTHPDQIFHRKKMFTFSLVLLHKVCLLYSLPVSLVFVFSKQYWLLWQRYLILIISDGCVTASPFMFKDFWSSLFSWYWHGYFWKGEFTFIDSLFSYLRSSSCMKYPLRIWPFVHSFSPEVLLEVLWFFAKLLQRVFWENFYF